MADAPSEHGPTARHQPEKSGNPEQVDKAKKGLTTGKNKWYLVGGLGLVAVLVFVFVKKSNGATATNDSTGSSTDNSSLDPSTESALESALQSASGGMSSGAQGPAGSAGPAGATGATGATGKTGATGAAGKAGTTTTKTTPPTTTKSPTPVAKPKTTAKSYTVKPGDSLSSIASQFKVSNWQTLYNANRTVVGSNPDKIYPGQKLSIP